ncbi:MAG: hypothetical protein ABIP21_08350 [Acidimicrobiia bacterium]
MGFVTGGNVLLVVVVDEVVVDELVVEDDVVELDVELVELELVDELDVVSGTVVVVVVVGAAVLSSVALPIATPMPAPASNNTNAIPQTPAGLMPWPSS